MGKDRGKPQSPSLDKVWLPPSLQTKLSNVFKFASTNNLRSAFFNNRVQTSSQTASSGEFGRRAKAETVHYGNGSQRDGLFLKGVSCPQKVRWVEASNRFVSVEQIPNPSYLSDGHAGKGKASPEARHVGYVNRLVGCVSPYTDSPCVEKISVFPDRQTKVQVSSSAIRPNVGSLAVYRDSKTVKKVGGSKLSSTFPVPRRLAKPTDGSRQADSIDTRIGKVVRPARAVGQPQKVRTSAGTEHCVSGRAARSASREGFSHPGSDRGSPSTSKCLVRKRASYLHTGGVSTGIAGSIVHHSAVGSSLSEKASTSGNSCSEGQRETFLYESDHLRASARTPSILAAKRRMGTGRPVSEASAPGNDLYRRLPARLGGSVRRSYVPRQVGFTQPSHKLLGVEDSAASTASLPIQVQEQGNPPNDRQFHSGGICEQARGNEIFGSHGVNGENRSAGTRLGMCVDSSTHYRQAKRAGGLGVASRSGGHIRMEAIPRGFRMGSPTLKVGQTTLGAIRQQPESPSSKVCVPVSRRSSLGGRRVDVPAAGGMDLVCIPASQPGDILPAKVTDVAQLQSAISSTVVTPGGLATPTTLAPSVSANTLPELRRDHVPATLGSPISSRAVSESPSVIFGEKRLKRLGYSDQVVQRLQKSHATSTTKQYKSKWALFVGWSSRQDPVVDPTSPTLASLADFLTWLFQARGLTAGSINNYRSAISFYWKREFDFDIPSDDQVLRDLMKSFVRDGVRSKKRVVAWDLKLVLEFFKSGKFASWDDLSAKELTLKTVFLVALASGKRRGELHALTREGVKRSHGTQEGMLLHPSPSFVSKTHLKTGGLGALKPVFIPKLRTDEVSSSFLCPVECIDQYINRSAAYRSVKQKQLFIPWQEGCTRDVRPATVSGYIKKAILLAYQDSNDEFLSSLQVVPHTVRHVATSLNAVRNFSMEDILRAGAWSSPNSFISHYLQDFTTDTLSGLSSIGGFVVGGSSF